MSFTRRVWLALGRYTTPATPTSREGLSFRQRLILALARR